MKRHLYMIPSLSCQGCVKTLTSRLSKIVNAQNISVDLETKIVTISSSSTEQINNILNQHGYEFSQSLDDARTLNTHNTIPHTPNTPNEETSTKSGSITVFIKDMACSSCVAKLEKTLNTISCITKIQTNIIDKTILIDGDFSTTTIITKLGDIGYPAEIISTKDDTAHKIATLHIGNMTCSSCVSKIEKHLYSQHGVNKAQVNLIDKTAIIEGYIHIAEIISSLNKLGYPTSISTDNDQTLIEKNQIQTKNEIKSSLIKSAVAAIVGIGIFIPGMLMSSWNIFPNIATNQHGAFGVSAQPFWIIMLIVTFATMYYSGGKFYKGAWQQLKNKSSNMDSLVALGTGAAFIYSAVVILIPTLLPTSMLHIFLDSSVLILAFINLGHALEAKAKGNTSEAIQKLIGMQSKTATVIKDSQEIQIPVDMLIVSDVVKILPGDIIPIDGTVIKGSTTIDESMLTGQEVQTAFAT